MSAIFTSCKTPEVWVTHFELINIRKAEGENAFWKQFTFFISSEFL